MVPGWLWFWNYSTRPRGLTSYLNGGGFTFGVEVSPWVSITVHGYFKLQSEYYNYWQSIPILTLKISEQSAQAHYLSAFDLLHLPKFLQPVEYSLFGVVGVVRAVAVGEDASLLPLLRFEISPQFVELPIRLILLQLSLRNHRVWLRELILRLSSHLSINLFLIGCRIGGQQVEPLVIVGTCLPVVLGGRGDWLVLNKWR